MNFNDVDVKRRPFTNQYVLKCTVCHLARIYYCVTAFVIFMFSVHLTVDTLQTKQRTNLLTYVRKGRFYKNNARRSLLYSTH